MANSGDREQERVPNPLKAMEPNRSLLFAELELSASFSEKGVLGYTLLVIDLNDFKQINIRHGHQAGDRLLLLIGNRLQQIANQHQVLMVYMGGDEFAFLAHEAGSNESVATLIYDINSLFGESFKVDHEQVLVGASMGVAHAPVHANDPNTLMCYAESAMYSAKRMGVDYSVHDPLRIGSMEENDRFEWELRMALYSQQLAVYFQPKVAIESGRLQGLEALVRWKHAKRGLLSPDLFIPVAERNGLIRHLTRWMLNATVRQCAIWKSQGIYVPVSVNLSGTDLVDQKLAEYIATVLEAWELSGHYLELEITETMAIDNYDACFAVLTELSRMGVRIAVDDFGTGYSSLTHLKQLPVDTIKIDKSFVMAMDEDDHDAHIVSAITRLAHKLGKRVIAEGVSSQENWNMLIDAGCDQAQGYHISHPLSVEEATEWLLHASSANSKNSYWH
jgi:diguanylate cyclase (GGDEF)-like protein